MHTHTLVNTTDSIALPHTPTLVPPLHIPLAPPPSFTNTSACVLLTRAVEAVEHLNT